MALQFDDYASKGKAFVAEVARELKTDDQELAGRMLRCVLRALRSRLTVEESFQLIGQLPLIIQGIYIDGWKVRLTPVALEHVSNFRSEVMKEDEAEALKDFSKEGSIDEAIKSVFRVLSRYLPEAELDHVLATLPEDIRLYIEEEA